MATVKPFHGVRYNPNKVEDLSKVVSQPYDRIRHGLQDQYYDLHPYNIVRITKGRVHPGDQTLPEEQGQPPTVSRRPISLHHASAQILVPAHPYLLGPLWSGRIYRPLFCRRCRARSMLRGCTEKWKRLRMRAAKAPARNVLSVERC